LGVVGWKARPQRHGAAQAGKSHWLVAISGRWEARPAIKVTGEPPATKSRNREAKIPDRRRDSVGLRDGAARGTPYTYRRKKRKK
jgi:hypothetical protein